MVFASAVDAIRRVIAAPGTQARKMRSSPTVVEDSMLAAAVLNEVINRVTTRRPRPRPLSWRWSCSQSG